MSPPVLRGARRQDRDPLNLSNLNNPKMPPGRAYTSSLTLVRKPYSEQPLWFLRRNRGRIYVACASTGREGLCVCLVLVFVFLFVFVFLSV